MASTIRYNEQIEVDANKKKQLASNLQHPGKLTEAALSNLFTMYRNGESIDEILVDNAISRESFDVAAQFVRVPLMEQQLHKKKKRGDLTELFHEPKVAT